jgi:hypothetical protein
VTLFGCRRRGNRETAEAQGSGQANGFSLAGGFILASGFVLANGFVRSNIEFEKGNPWYRQVLGPRVLVSG